MSPTQHSELAERLAAPFEPTELKFRAGSVSGSRAQALVYVNARVVQDRLDDVMGVFGWQDSYELLDAGNVVCTLRLRVGEEWVAKMDVGGPSMQPDSGDKCKAAFSEALKRAAVKFGIGRYLYRFPLQWMDYDPQKKQLIGKPTIPAWALPAPSQPAAPVPAKPAQQQANGSQSPQTLAELFDRIATKESELIAQWDNIVKGELIEHVRQAIINAGYHDEKLWRVEIVSPIASKAVKVYIATLEEEEPPPAGEIIGQKERLELPRLMKAAQRTWPQCCAWLQQQGAPINPQMPVNDLTMQQFLLLKTGLEKIIKNQPQSTNQKAG